MDRISTTTKAVDLFGSGKHGFKDGNLGLGVAPTDFNAEWFNGVQEELLNVIEAGGVVPAAGTRNQLLASLGGALASQPVMARTLGATGYQKFPGGLIIQWGTSAVIASGANLVITLPIAFPNTAFKVFTTFAQGSDVATGGVYIGMQRDILLNSITVRNLGPSSAQYDWLVLGN